MLFGPRPSGRFCLLRLAGGESLRDHRRFVNTCPNYCANHGTSRMKRGNSRKLIC
ncbi:hypothetical protein DAI22_01g254250 [Oryza sativa Japonica Group]|nr:hypothetical protein DAI22_01g254250 [Oryza sativa Japonica Group]